MADEQVTEQVETNQTPPEAVTAPQVPVLNGVTDPFESRAKRMGWVPKDDFRGDGGAQWVDAETFIRRAEQSADILIERNKALDRRLEQSEKVFGSYKENSEKQLKEMSGQLKELQDTLVDFRNFATTANERAYRKARTELESEMRQAVAEADITKFDRAKSQVDELDKDAREVVRDAARTQQTQPATPVAETTVPAASAAATQTQPQAPLPPPPPEVGAWISRNQWFLNPDYSYMNQYAQRTHMKLLNEEPTLSLAQNLEKVTDLTRKKFPEEFGINPRREEVSAVANTTATRTTAPKKKTYDDLPADAKQACDRYVRTIPGYTQSEYVEVFFLGDEE